MNLSINLTKRVSNALFLQLETIQQENEQLKDRVEELTLDLEILKNEISEGGTLLYTPNCRNVVREKEL